MIQEILDTVAGWKRTLDMVFPQGTVRDEIYYWTAVLPDGASGYHSRMMLETAIQAVQRAGEDLCIDQVQVDTHPDHVMDNHVRITFHASEYPWVPYGLYDVSGTGSIITITSS